MRGLPRRNMFRLAQPIMIGCVAALGTALRAEGDSVPFYPLGLFGGCKRFERRMLSGYWR